mgnify:CR=1 FL=1
MKFSYCFDNVYKGRFILVVIDKAQILPEEYDKVLHFIQNNHPTIEELTQYPDIIATEFKEITNDNEYVFILESDIDLDLSVIEGFNEVIYKHLRMSDVYNCIIMCNQYKLRRLNRTLLPFL